MSEWAPKRFWDRAEPVEAQGGWGVALDGRPLRTPAKAPLVVPGLGLAQAIAEEWHAQEGKVNPETMPLTRAANAAIDKVSAARAGVIDMLAAYGETDLVCHRAEAPDGLVERERAAWDPLLDWAAEALGARLVSVSGVLPAHQPPEALAALHAGLEAMSDFELAAMHDLVTLPGSIVIGFAAAREAWPLDDLWERAHVDELFQEEGWGRDDEAAEARDRRRGGFEQAHRFWQLCNRG